MKMSLDLEAALSMALSATKCRAPDVIGELHAAYHCGDRLSRDEIELRLTSARKSAELILRLITSAERALTAPTIIHMEAAE